MVFNFRILASAIALAAIAQSIMPARAATYYVSTAANASNGNAGTESSPWRTITYAATQAKAGDTVLIKAGNYGNEHVVVKNSGSNGKPITFEGYGGAVNLGTLPNPRTTPAESEVGFTIASAKNYITLRNLHFTWYYNCIYVSQSDYVILDNIVIEKCGATGAQGDGVFFTWSDHATMTNCTVSDAGGNNVEFANSHYCLVDNLRTLGTLDDLDTYATDYYFVMKYCHDNVVQNSLADDTIDSNKGNHGFIIKDQGGTSAHSTNNTFKDCKAYSFAEAFAVAHLAYGNQFIRCTADNSTRGGGYNAAFEVRNGAHDNTFRDCTAIGKNVVVALTSFEEGNAVNKAGNKFINCTLRGIDQASSIGVLFNMTSGTVFENCVFDKVYYFARYVKTNTGNSFKNSIIYSIPKLYDAATNNYYPMGGTAYNGTGNLTVTYCDFFDNGFSSFGGDGCISTDPKFANAATSDYHLMSKNGRWTGSAWVKDDVDSPCIDAGDKFSDYSNEPVPNGGRINIGRYGNTAEASKSSGGGTVMSPYDNRLLERDPAIVYTSNTYLDVGHNTSNAKKYRDLIWFDLSPYHGPVKKATLSLYWYHPAATRTNDTVIDIYRPAMGWNHSYACWSNKASGVAWTNAGGDWFDKNSVAQGSAPYASVTFSASQLATNQYYSFDVTKLVNEYLASGQNAGFFIKARTEADNYIAFYGLSASETAKRPKLEIAVGNAIHADAWSLYQ